MSRKNKIALLSVFLLAVLATPALAVHPDARSEIENLKERIQLLEQQDRKNGAVLLNEYLEIHGVIEAEGYYFDQDGEEAASDLVVATAELSFEATLNDALAGHLILLFEEGDAEAPDGEDTKEVDEAVISLTCPKPLAGQTPMLHVGRMYLPFGMYNSAMISDPLTLELGESQNTALLFALEGDLWNFSLGLFNGEVDVVGDKSHVDDFVAAFEVAPVEGLAIGASYISDLAESGSELVDLTNPEPYADAVAGISGFLSAQYSAFGLEFEYLAAQDDFDAAVIAGTTDLTGAEPQAWNLELNWLATDNVQIAARYEEAEDYQDDMQRYGATISYGLYEHAVVALEYLKADADLVADDDAESATAQLALEF